MPFPLLYGALPEYDRKEFEESGLLTESFSFTPDQEIKVKNQHLPGNYGVPGQVQVWRKSLGMELKGGIIPDSNGKAVGLAACYAGEAVVCMHFAAAAVPVARHGFTRDDNMLLMVEAPKTELGDDVPSVTVPMRYFPTVAKNLIALPPQA